jgi:hypothetical protein
MVKKNTGKDNRKNGKAVKKAISKASKALKACHLESGCAEIESRRSL